MDEPGSMATATLQAVGLTSSAGGSIGSRLGTSPARAEGTNTSGRLERMDDASDEDETFVPFSLEDDWPGPFGAASLGIP